MAAQSSSHAPSRPKKYVTAERRAARSDDTEIALDMQLAAIVAKREVDVLVIADLDGAPVASAGDVDEAILLGAFAAALAKEIPMRRAVTTTRGFVQVDLVESRGRTFVIAAYARHGVPCPVGVARAVGGAARILQGGLTIDREAPLPLVERGGWGDWPEI
jgi:hypothetical protein